MIATTHIQLIDELDDDGSGLRAMVIEERMEMIDAIEESKWDAIFAMVTMRRRRQGGPRRWGKSY